MIYVDIAKLLNHEPEAVEEAPTTAPAESPGPDKSPSGVEAIDGGAV